MRAVLLHGEGEVTVGEVPEPVPGPGEVLLRVTRAALCGSEFGLLRGPRRAPTGTGHEAVGVVEEPGDAPLRRGQRAGVLAVNGCGSCPQCARGRFPRCGAARGMAPSHAEYVAVPAANCLPLPDDLSDDAAIAVFGCGIGVAYHGSRRLAAEPGQNVLVLGAGPIGLSAVLVLRHLGIRPLAADTNSRRLALAAELGAEACIPADAADFTARLREACGGLLADAAFLASGNPTALATALAAIEPGGAVVTVGGVSDFALSTFRDLSVRDRALVGSWHFHKEEMAPLLRLVRAGLPAERIITHRFPLEEAPAAYRLFAAGAAAKTLLVPPATAGA